MSGTVWTKFYWNDWLSDPGLRRSSLAARGLWIDLLCVMAQHDPIGFLATRGEALSISDVARMTGISETDASTLMGELDRNGVFSRDRNGRIYSRRMVRDAKRSSEGRKYKREAMEAKLREKQEKIADLEGGLEAHLQAHKPRANSHKPESSSAIPPAQPPPAREAFDEVDAALRRIVELGSHPVAADPVIAPVLALVQQGYDLRTEILPSIRRQLARRTKPISRWAFFVPGIVEDRDSARTVPKPRAAAEVADIGWPKRMTFAREIKAWDTPKWGPAPNTPGCRVPPDLVQPEDGKGWIEYAHWRPSP